MSDQLALLPGYLTAHLQLALLALGIGIGVSIPVGIWLTRSPRLEPVALGIASVIQTIPSLALLAIMVPTLAALGARGIGFTPALVALALYAILPVLRNTVTGIAGVDPTLVEAARGAGMTDAERLRRVELPLALPVIVAGVRTSAVWIVGTATLSTPVGATSLGNFIFSGLQTRNHTAVLVGCVAAAGLAIVLDQLIRLLEVGVQRRRRGLVSAAITGLVVLALYAGAAFAWERTRDTEARVTIGAKAFTEQYILAEIVSQRVALQGGAAPRVLSSLGSTVAFDALRNGDIDLYVDYSGTIWATIMKREEPAARGRILEEVGRFLERTHGIHVLAALGFENTYALGMERGRAERLGVMTISQLARVAPRLEIGGDYEFFQRAEWDALVRSYGLRFRLERSMDPALMYQAAAQGAVDVISAFSTDGRIATYDLVLLEDDRGVIPPYDAILLAGSRLLEARPELAAALRDLDGAIDADAMRRMNLAVDRDKRSPTEVAREFLAD